MRVLPLVVVVAVLRLPVVALLDAPAVADVLTVFDQPFQVVAAAVVGFAAGAAVDGAVAVEAVAAAVVEAAAVGVVVAEIAVAGVVVEDMTAEVFVPVKGQEFLKGLDACDHLVVRVYVGRGLKSLRHARFGILNSKENNFQQMALAL